MTVCAMKHEAFILRTKAGQWMFQVHRDGEEIGGGAGFADVTSRRNPATRSRHIPAS